MNALQKLPRPPRGLFARLALLAALLAAPWAAAQEADAADPPARVGSISALRGPVEFSAQAGAAWDAARVNQPVTGQGELWAPPGSQAAPAWAENSTGPRSALMLPTRAGGSAASASWAASKAARSASRATRPRGRRGSFCRAFMRFNLGRERAALGPSTLQDRRRWNAARRRLAKNCKSACPATGTRRAGPAPGRATAHMTAAMALATASRLCSFSAATQMRPESTP